MKSYQTLCAEYQRERQRLKTRLLKHILENQRRREQLRRNAAPATTELPVVTQRPTPHLPMAPPAAAPIQEAG